MAFPRMPVLELFDVTKKIRGKTVVDQVSFCMFSGEVLGLLGPSGAGKTAVIRMICGLSPLTEGEIRIEGHGIREEFEQAVRYLGAMIDQPKFYPFLTGRANLELFARLHGGTALERIDLIAAKTGLSGLLDEPAGTYSSGVQRRLGIAQALLHEPTVLVLDEPFNGLDPKSARDIRELLRDLAKEEMMAIFVSGQQLSDVQQLCDRVAILQYGRLTDIRRVSELESAGDEPVDVEWVLHQPEELIHAINFLCNDAVLIRRQSDRVIVNMRRSMIPAVNQRVAAKGAQIFAIKPDEPALENQLQKWTGGVQS